MIIPGNSLQSVSRSVTAVSINGLRCLVTMITMNQKAKRKNPPTGLPSIFEDIPSNKPHTNQSQAEQVTEQVTLNLRH